MDVLILDNQDSFTYNLYDYLTSLGASCTVVRKFQEIDKDLSEYSSIILSPGPGSPNSHPEMEALLKLKLSKPILGICLGHQALACYFGAKLEKLRIPFHGKLSGIKCVKDPLFNGMPSGYSVVRYHSLIVTELPSSLQCIARTEQGEIMAIKHISLPYYGIQFHPEAFMSQYGREILQNWLFLSGVI
ncbi:MAG: anthranilate synthase component II [Cytophagaceae bacterium]